MTDINLMMPDRIYPPRHFVTLSKSQKGTYAWDIKVESENMSELITKLKQIDTELRKEFGANQNGESSA